MSGDAPLVGVGERLPLFAPPEEVVGEPRLRVGGSTILCVFSSVGEGGVNEQASVSGRGQRE